MKKNVPTVITAFDRGYLHMGLPMIKSCIKYIPDCRIYCELINCTKAESSLVSSISSACEVKGTTNDFKHPIQLKCYATNRRGQLFYALRKRQDGPLMWLDADSLVRRDCGELIEESCKYDISVVVRPNPTPTLGVRGGIIIINNSARGGQQFIKEYRERVKKENLWRQTKNTKLHLPPNWKTWMANQSILDDMCRENKAPDLNFNPLSNSYCDCHLKNDSYIWAAKNKLKTSEKYLTEIKKYS